MNLTRLCDETIYFVLIAVLRYNKYTNIRLCFPKDQNTMYSRLILKVRQYISNEIVLYIWFPMSHSQSNWLLRSESLFCQQMLFFRLPIENNLETYFGVFFSNSTIISRPIWLPLRHNVFRLAHCKSAGKRWGSVGNGLKLRLIVLTWGNDERSKDI